MDDNKNKNKNKNKNELNVFKNKNELNVFNYDYRSWKYPSNWFANIKQFFKNLKYAYQRAKRGYSDRDIWNLDMYLTYILRDTVHALAETTHGYPGYESLPDFDNTYESWIEFLEKLSTLFDKSLDRSLDEDSGKYYGNAFEDDYMKAIEEGRNKRNDPEFKDLMEHYIEREKQIARTRENDRDIAFKLLSKYFDHLWD